MSAMLRRIFPSSFTLTKDRYKTHYVVIDWVKASTDLFYMNIEHSNEITRFAALSFPPCWSPCDNPIISTSRGLISMLLIIRPKKIAGLACS